MVFKGAYVTVIALTHLGFAVIFLFLHLHRRSKFLVYFALAWIFEALRVCLPVARTRGIQFSDRWFALQDVLYLVVTWLLLAAAADFVGKRSFPRLWPALYFGLSIPAALVNHVFFRPFFLNPDAAVSQHELFLPIFVNSLVLFLPGGVARLLIAAWFFGFWKRSRLRGGFILAVFFLLHALGSLSVPLRWYYSYEPPDAYLIWFVEILGLSVGVVILAMQQRQAELAAAEQKYQLFFDRMADAALLFDHNEFCIAANPIARKRLSIHDRPGFYLKDLFAEESAYQAFSRAMPDSGSLKLETRLKTPGGEIFPASISGAIHRDAGPKLSGYFITLEDITERKQAEERLRLTVESAPNAMVMVNQDGRIVLVNSQTEKLFGYEREELVGQPVEVLVPAQFRGRHPEYRTGFFADPRSRPMGAGRDLYGLRKDGTEFPVEIGLNPMETEEGIWVLSAIVDITERKRAEEERAQLLASERAIRKEAERAADWASRLQSVTSAFSGALTPTDVAKIVIEQGVAAMNASAGVVAVRDVGGEQLKLLGAVNYPKDVIDAWRRLSISIWDTPLGEAVRTGQAVLLESIEALLQRYPQLATVSPSVGGGARAAIPLQVHGQTIGGLWLAFEGPRTFNEDDRGLMTVLAQQCAQALERARLYEAEQAARAEAERANRLKDEFLSTVSHELRTPLMAVLGWTRLLQRGQLDESGRQQALEVIERNARAQAKLIEEILDVSRIVSGRLRLDIRPVELPKLIDAAIGTVMPAAESKRLRIEKVIDPRAGAISGDPERLQQVVWNLLSNAVKFTPEGGRVEVRLTRLGPQVEIKVSDTGEGIRAEFLPHLFEPFRQADATPSRRHTGLGLGLAIVQRLVNLHAGTVHAHSAGPGKGATFSVRLPIAFAQSRPADTEPDEEGVAAPPETLPETAPALSGLRILVVEDVADIRDFLTLVLERYGSQVSAVASVQEALEAFNLGKIDVLVCDIGLPGQDGYSLIRQVRALGAAAGGDIPALALTGYARTEDQQRAHAAGFQMHVPKPIDPLELARAIEHLARTHPVVTDKIVTGSG